MKYLDRLAFICLWLCFLVAGCRPVSSSDNKKTEERITNQATETECADLSQLAQIRADSILGTLTLEEKIAQILMPAIFSSDDNYTLKVVGEYGKLRVGGVVLLKGTSSQAKFLADSLTKASSIPPFISIDAEWGLGMRLTDEPSYPVNSEVGKTATETEMFEYGREVANQCHQLGINMVLGPVVDVATSGSYINRRSFGCDPVRVSDLAVAYARGLESGGVMSVAKHFPGHGSTLTDSHKRKTVIDRSLNQMDSIDLYPFKKYIEAGLSAVMVGHIAVPAIDPEMQPAAVSKSVITELLKNDLGFQGLVLTDALTMGGAEGNGADKALAAGADIILAPVNTRKEINKIARAIEEGDLSEQRLDESVRKVLFYKTLLTIKNENTSSKGTR